MNYGGHFDPENRKLKIKELESKTLEPNFWNDKTNSEKIINELNNLKNSLDSVETLKKEIKNNIDMLEILKEEDNKEIRNELENEIETFNNKIEDLEVSLLLNGKYDKCGAILEIHPGAGGVDSMDFASMLERMYLRYCEKKGFKTDIIDEQPGDEAGLKSASILIKGINVYGYLKCEKGVHRLIRLSPFNANNKRQTSFVSIDVEPILENNEINVDINPNDIRIDIYRSSGNGGQGVNTTDSAVRITHLPTKIVVTCQNERSQIQNKEKAMEVLKSKLYVLEQEKKEKELKQIKGDNMDINFGSQIRTYTLHPYSLVKDHRTNTENTNVIKVLDGDIDKFIKDNLKGKC